jgi:hypothetical protein
MYSISICTNRRRPRESLVLVVVLVLVIGNGAVEDENEKEDEDDLVATLPRCAVSQSCAPPAVGNRRRVGPIRRPADCKSAIRQIENLRYKPSACRAVNRYVSWDTAERQPARKRRSACS